MDFQQGGSCVQPVELVPHEERQQWGKGRRPLRTSALAVMLITAVIPAVSGCATVDPTNPAAPLIVCGVVHDIDEQPVSDAVLSLSISGPMPESVDEPGPEIFKLEVAGAPDGTYQFRYPPNDAVRALASGRGGKVTVSIYASDNAGNQLGYVQFYRMLDEDGWSGVAPSVVLRPSMSGPDGSC
jgi:hypothetical protein